MDSLPFNKASEEVQAEMVSARAAYRESVLDFRIIRPLGFRGNDAAERAFKTALQTDMISGGVDGKAAGQAPPDLPSLLLDARICYLGMPLVPSVTELIVAELLYLNFVNPEKPIYFYINSTGSQSADGQAVGFETEAYAIFDTMRYIKPECLTVCVGKAHGNAAMLLASGKKGERHALPHSSIILQPPRLNRTSDVATNVMIKANECIDNTETYTDFLSTFTGKSKADLEPILGRKKYFTPHAAREFGLIDKVVESGAGLVREKKDYDAGGERRGGGRVPTSRTNVNVGAGGACALAR